MLADWERESTFSLSRRSSMSDSLLSSSAPTTPVTSTHTLPDIRSELRALRLNGLLQRAQRNSQGLSLVKLPYMAPSIQNIVLYIRFCLSTWLRIVLTATLWPHGTTETLCIILFDLGSLGILYVLLLWCLLANLRISRTVYEQLSSYFCKGLSFTNSAYPRMFEELDEPALESAKEVLNASPSLVSTSNKRVFHVDVAKLLLQCSAIMYERQDHAARSAVMSLEPLASSNSVSNLHFATALLENEEDRIQLFAKQLGLEYSTISDLNTDGTSFCGLFWAPQENFIIISYRGTASAEYSEWMTDFSASFTDAGSNIRGWDQVHGGFAKRAFPEDLPEGHQSPYDAIKLAVKALSDHLSSAQAPGTKINVWSTGHSLGSAIGSLIYARQITEPLDFGENVFFCDAYFFGSPVVCNNLSKLAFNESIKANRSKTLWRITNGQDIVATGVPHLGDKEGTRLSSLNPLSFTHIGTNISMQPHTGCTGVVYPTEQSIEVSSSASSSDEYSTSERWISRAQSLPIVGRFISHATTSYWIRLKYLNVNAIDD